MTTLLFRGAYSWIADSILHARNSLSFTDFRFPSREASLFVWSSFLIHVFWMPYHRFILLMCGTVQIAYGMQMQGKMSIGLTFNNEKYFTSLIVHSPLNVVMLTDGLCTLYFSVCLCASSSKARVMVQLISHSKSINWGNSFFSLLHSRMTWVCRVCSKSNELWKLCVLPHSLLGHFLSTVYMSMHAFIFITITGSFSLTSLLRT